MVCLHRNNACSVLWLNKSVHSWTLYVGVKPNSYIAQGSTLLYKGY